MSEKVLNIFFEKRLCTLFQQERTFPAHNKKLPVILKSREVFLCNFKISIGDVSKHCFRENGVFKRNLRSNSLTPIAAVIGVREVFVVLPKA